jgi:hypothetical protein
VCALRKSIGKSDDEIWKLKFVFSLKGDLFDHTSATSSLDRLAAEIATWILCPLGQA